MPQESKRQSKRPCMEDIPSCVLITLFYAYFWNTVVQSKTTWVVLGGRPFVICQLKTEGINPETETHFQRKMKNVQAAVENQCDDCC